MEKQIKKNVRKPNLKKQKTRKPINPVVFVIALVILIGAVGFGVHMIAKFTPTKDHMDLTEYYGQPSDGEAVIILGTNIMEQKAAVSGDQMYLPLDLVNTYLNQRFYWDSANSQILYATPSELRYYPASDAGGSEVWLKDGTVYLNLNFVKQYTDLDTYIYDSPARVAIQYQFSNITTATVKKDSAVRYRGGIKSEILSNVSKGDTLIYMEALEEWVQVATWDGYIGYIQKDAITEAETTIMDRSFETEEYTYLTMDTKVNLAWHQVTNSDANAYLSDDIANVSGVNVISPTWFYISDTAGNIANFASADYVSQAHSLGMQVWGLIDNFTAEVSTTETLSQLSSRQNIISQLISVATSVGMDGINVDFETLSEDCIPHYLEFLRELSIECHKNNLVLSVDDPAPEDYTNFYDRAEQGKVVDYVILMGYDEHYVGSEVGSVASLPWVQQGIEDTIAEVPAERTILAIPFYTRLWKTTAGGAVTSEAIGMDDAQNVLSTNGLSATWDGSVSQNYATYEDSEGSTYQIWLEDAQSIAAKVQMVSTYGLAGVAEWKLGFQNNSIWQTISENLG